MQNSIEFDVLDGFLTQTRLNDKSSKEDPSPWRNWNNHNYIWYHNLSDQDKTLLKSGKSFFIRSFLGIIVEVRLIKHYPQIKPCSVCGKTPFLETYSPLDREIDHLCSSGLRLSIRDITSKSTIITAWNAHQNV